jgi:peptide deformylase
VTVQPVRLFGDPVLRARADEARSFDRELRQLVTDLTDTMKASGGVGMAGPQIGVGLRVFVYHVDEEEHGHLINPVLSFPSDEEQDGPEGCLSIPDLTFDCKRHQHVVATGFNSYGDPVTIEGSEVLARCVQHETDHLDGVLFVDRLDPETKREAMKAIREAEWAGAATPRVKSSPHRLFGVAR